jgi:cytochrome c-type biogenesis protein CcmH/NrfF
LLHARLADLVLATHLVFVVLQRLRAVAGQAGYEGGFIERYASQLLYPADWETVHLWLGICLVLLNLLIYGVWFRQVRARRRAG